jgi:hypothetical protein
VPKIRPSCNNTQVRNRFHQKMISVTNQDREIKSMKLTVLDIIFAERLHLIITIPCLEPETNQILFSRNAPTIQAGQYDPWDSQMTFYIRRHLSRLDVSNELSRPNPVRHTAPARPGFGGFFRGRFPPRWRKFCGHFPFLTSLGGLVFGPQNKWRRRRQIK